MKYLPLLLAVGALVLAGCSSTPAKVDSGTIHGRTFSFVNRAARPAPGYADDRQAIHDMIHQSITKTLAARGLTPVPAGGDLTVGYLVIVGNNASTEMINDYFGYGADAAGLHDKAQEAYTGSKNPNYFEAGTLLIDIVDSQNFKLLKRGYATRPTLRGQSADARAAQVQDAVDEILRDVRVAP
jgi:hypothetical protein